MRFLFLLSWLTAAGAAETPPCVFCEIIAGTRPQEAVVYRDDRVVAFLSIGPRNPGHLLVVPRAHAETFTDVAAPDMQAMTDAARRLVAALRRTDLKMEGYHVQLNSGRAAGQSVFHAHLHIIPRHAGEAPAKTPEDRVAMEVLAPIAAKIRAALAESAAATQTPEIARAPAQAEVGQFMADYARQLLAADREGLIRLYSSRGTLLLADGLDDVSSPDMTAQLYRDTWVPPTTFAWRDLSYRFLHPEVCVVDGGFDWTGPNLPRGGRFNYSAVLVRDEGKWRIRSEAEFQAAPAAATPESAATAFVLPAINTEVPLARIREICLHYGLHRLWRKIASDPPPRPFKSDGCTGWFDEWKGVSLYPAGFLHDLKYWAGYPGEEVERLAADAEFMLDVARVLQSTTMAETMFHGVRVGGHEQLQASFSWGFGRAKP